MPGVCAVLGSSWSPGITLTPCVFQSIGWCSRCYFTPCSTPVRWAILSCAQGWFTGLDIDRISIHLITVESIRTNMNTKMPDPQPTPIEVNDYHAHVSYNTD